MWYPAITTTPPAVEPLTLAAAKQFLRIDADLTSFDIEVGAAIAGARGEVEDFTGSRLITQEVSLQADRWEDLAHLPIGPVQELLSLSWRRRDTEDAEIDLSTVERFGGTVGQGIRPTAGNRWPDEHWQDLGYRCEWGDSRARRDREGLIITVGLRVGYGADATALPASLNVALLLAARGIYDDKPVDLSSRLGSHRIWL